MCRFGPKGLPVSLKPPDASPCWHLAMDNAFGDMHRFFLMLQPCSLLPHKSLFTLL